MTSLSDSKHADTTMKDVPVDESQRQENHKSTPFGLISYVEKVYLPRLKEEAAKIEVRAIYEAYKEPGTTAAQDPIIRAFDFVQLVPHQEIKACSFYKTEKNIFGGDLNIRPGSIASAVWSIVLDSGRYGIPSVSLGVKLALGDSTKTDWNHSSTYIEQSAVFYTNCQGPKERLGICSDETFTSATFNHTDPQVDEFLKASQGYQDLEKEAPVWQLGFWYDLPKDSTLDVEHSAAAKLRQIAFGSGSIAITMKTKYQGIDRVLKHLEWNVRHHHMPHYPYRLTNGEFEMEVNNWQNIREFWGGMFATYEGKYQKAKTYHRHEVERSFHSPYHYFIRHATNAVQEYQTERVGRSDGRSKHSCLVIQHERIGEKVPGLEKIKDQHTAKDLSRSYFWICVKLQRKSNKDGQRANDYLTAPGTNIRFAWVIGTPSEHTQDKDHLWERMVINPMNSSMKEINLIVLVQKSKDG
ncbi:MAG: hypothetical protein M1812_006070 [Candelaria pacifica]|nr:MAG: hypothetical protein M1812_006070 [Candelaria pacifica]